MCATPCGTTRFSRFFLNSFLRLDAFSGAFVASTACSFAKLLPFRAGLTGPALHAERIAKLISAGRLLPRGDFLLGRDRALARSLAGARVGVRALPANGKI